MIPGNGFAFRASGSLYRLSYMRKVAFALIWWFCNLISLVQAADNSEIIIVPPGWQRVEVDAPPGSLPLPTFKYVPQDHRNAALLITILGRGDGRISDRTSLDTFHRMMCRRFLATPNDTIAQTDVRFPNGIGVYSSFEDPALIGKASNAGDYKVATPVALLLTDGMVVQATIFTDEKTGETFDQALNSLETIDLPSSPESGLSKRIENGKTIIGVTSLSAELVIPADVTENSLKLNRSTTYFSFVAANGVLMSGWLEPASKYKGLPEMWVSEKRNIEAGTGVTCEEEQFAVIGDWETVAYTIKLPNNVVQQNLRACRILGNTWVDLHLSITAARAETTPLETLLSSVSLRLKK